MNWKDINREYIELVKKNPEKHLKSYEKAIEKASGTRGQYKDKPIPFLYHPMIYTKKDLRAFEEIGHMMISITNKVTKKYEESPSFREKFGFSKELEELILVDNGYDINVPIGRFDIFYENHSNFKFCELNTDGSAAMFEENIISNLLMETQAIKELGEKYDISYFELIKSWVSDSLDIYKKFDKDIEKPNVAIVDFRESGTSLEFIAFKEAYEKMGCKTIIADPRDLEYRDGNLYFEDFKIDLVYRRIVTFELMKNIDEIPDFIEAYKNQAFCSIGSIKSQIMHNKVIFKILHDEDTLEFLSGEEKEFIKNHIPFTGEFKEKEEVYEKVLKKKNKYIMKPSDLNASRGVYVGRDLSQEEWKEKLDESWNQDYIYQEFIEQEPFLRDFVVFEDGKVKTEKFGSVIGLYMYKEKFAGIYTRVGQENVISGLTSYYALANLLVK